MSDYFTEYPTHIIVPDGYWTITTTINVDTDVKNKDIYWHHNED